MVLLGCMSITMLLSASCKKYTDEPGQSDTRLSRKYCNDPEAVNFNRDFPGTEDNSVCIFPADAFEGRYVFTDSLFNGAGKRITELSPVTLSFIAQSRVKLSVTGFCNDGTKAITLTANRVLRATADTTVLNGQLLCREKDTVSGYITQATTDSTRIQFFLTVASDTGTVFHRGTAYRQ